MKHGAGRACVRKVDAAVIHRETERHVRERIGCHHGRWRDVVLVERRSPIAGG